MFAQIIAICIFVTMFLLIILDKFERHYITLGSGALVLVLVFGVCMHSMSAILETLNLGAFFQSTFWYGASANVVGTSASAKGGYPIGWGRYCKYCVPATIIVMAVSTAYLFLRYL